MTIVLDVAGDLKEGCFNAGRTGKGGWQCTEA